MKLHKPWILWALGIVAAILIVGSSLFGYKQWRKSQIIIPAAINNQITFAIFWPQKPAPITADKQTVKFDAGNKLLTYTAHTANGIRLVFSEQPTPDSFTDVPQVYDKLIESLQQYGDFDTVSGKVFLTHPKELDGGQSAVMNTKGMLMFVKPDKNLSDDTWRQIFNNLQIIQ